MKRWANKLDGNDYIKNNTDNWTNEIIWNVH